MTTWDERLAAASVDPDGDPLEGWRRLRLHEGESATIADLYELAAQRRGLHAADLPMAERHALGRAAMGELWPGHGVAPGSDRPVELIQIVPYDPTWPGQFQVWQQRISDALGSAGERIEHVGSTSVPGLIAKPIIDIQISVADLADEDSYVPQLAGIGLQLRSRDEFHRYFRPFPDRPRDVHVHVCQVGSTWEDDHLTFRNFLRAHPEARHEYLAAKQAAVRDWADDSYAYTDAKTAAVRHALAQARADRTRTESGSG